MSIKDNGDFVLHNCGRRPVYVDGQPLITDKTIVLSHNQIVEVRFDFVGELGYHIILTDL